MSYRGSSIIHKARVVFLFLGFIFLASSVYADFPQFGLFDPLNASMDISLTPTLTWSATDPDPTHTLTYDVYFGTSSPPQLVSTNQAGSTYQPGQLSSTTVYYWQVVARDNVGNETAGPILSFTTLNNLPQLSSFTPSDGAIGVSRTPTLSWSGSDDPGDTLIYDVYFGTSSPPSIVSTNQSGASYQPGQLSTQTTYYWRVIAKDNHGGETAGPILFFTTLNNPPQLGTFSPSDGATGVSQTLTLSWSGSDPDGDAVAYDVYLGTSSPPPLVSYNQAQTSYFSGQLGSLTLYYWQVVARDIRGTETAGPTLSFTTINRLPQFSGYSPAQESVGIGLTPTLSWSAADPDPDDTLVYDVYFGASSPPLLVSSNHTGTSYQPGRLAYSGRYYWNVIARDRHGYETSIGVVYFNTVNSDNAVDHSASAVSRPQVASDDSGHVYIVWEDARNGQTDIYLNYSSDYGATWHTSDKRLDKDTAGMGKSAFPQIICDNSGHVYVVWRDTRSGNPEVYFNYSSNYGVTWQSSDKNLGAMPSNPNTQLPKIACDNNGHVYVAWNDNYFNTSADFGATWLTQPMRISTAGGEDTQLTCDQNSRVYVAWRLGTTNVLFNCSLDSGSTWQPTDGIVSGPGAIPSGGLSLASDNSGRIYCAWHDTRNSASTPDIYFNSSSDYGNTWGASDVILNTGTPGTTNSTWPEVACDASGNVYGTWNDGRNGLGDIYLNYSNDTGINWQTQDKRLDTDAAGTVDSGYPEITVDGSGNVYVIWPDDQVGIGSGIYLNHSLNHGAAWLPTNRKIGSIGNDPQIKSNSSRLYIVRENNDIIFTKLAPFIPAAPLPQDGAVQVNVTPTFSWSGGDFEQDDALTYDVYFGTSSTPPLVSYSQTGTSYMPGTLDFLTTYYWKVVTRNSSGAETAGPIWSFTTASGPPQFVSFSPPNGATNVGIDDDLSWTATDPDPGDTLVYDVYFGTANPPPKIASNWSSSVYNPGRFRSYTVYYWKVVARDNHGSETVGPVLTFTTINHSPQFVSTSFSPANGATGVPLNPPENPLRWAATDADGDPLRYDIYFGTSPNPPLVLSNQSVASYQPGQLTHMTVYYWKIAARDSHEAEITSEIRSFTTLDNPPNFTFFLPTDKTKGVGLIPTLSWSATDPDPDDTLTYDIYFGGSSNVSGYGVSAPDISPVNSIDFGTVNVGSLLKKTTTISNNGTATLRVTSVVLFSGSTDFAYKGPATPFKIDPGDSKDITLKFTPTSAGPQSGEFLVVSDDPDEQNVIFNVSGNGAPLPDIEQVAAVSFGDVNMLGYLERTTSIINSGLSPLTINSVALLSGSTEFTYTGPPTPFTITAGGSQEITLRYSPMTSGAKSGVFRVYSNDTDEPYVEFNVSGNGVTVPNIKPIVSLDFGDVGIGSYIDKTTRITNSGLVSLLISSVTVQSGSTEFIYVGPNTPFTIPAGESQDITVRFSPATAGAKSDILHVHSNDPDAPDVAFNVTGNNAPLPDIAPVAAIDFGRVNMGGYLEKTTTIFNTGTAPLMINDVVVTTGSTEFTYKGPAAPFTVPAGGSQDLTVRFSPSAAGLRRGELHVYSNDPDEPDMAFALPLALSNQTVTNYQPGQLSYSKKYYWKIVARDPHGMERSTPLLSFDTVSNPPEFNINSFSPSDGTTNLKLSPTLMWSASDPDGDPLTYDIYLGSTPQPPLMVSNQTVNTYKPPTLFGLTTYYWKVVAKDNNGSVTEGPILSFTTGNPPAITYVDPNPCQPLQRIRIAGQNFGVTQGTSKIFLGAQVFGPSSAKIKSWSDTEIILKVPPYTSLPAGQSKIKDLRVRVNNIYSNIYKLTIYKP